MMLLCLTIHQLAMIDQVLATSNPITFIANCLPVAIVILRSIALIRPICTILLCRMIEANEFRTSRFYYKLRHVFKH
jgi:energy-converting hydrogenase Eha subunit C